MNMEGKINGIYFVNEITKKRINKGDNFIPVDSWEPTGNEDVIFSCIPGYFIAPITSLFHVETDDSNKINRFMLSTKKCYNSLELRSHMFRYINYFSLFYDWDKEYLTVLYQIKLRIERFSAELYPKEIFFSDIERYILRSNIYKLVCQMVEDNYQYDLDYKNFKSPALQYTNEHAKILYRMSILMNLCIPLLTTYAYMHKVDGIDDYLLSLYDRILHLETSVDMYTKLYDTAFTNVRANQKNNIAIWNKQDIRGIDTVTHSTDCVNNIILNIMPKYTFTSSIISFNYSSIKTNTAFKITDVSFEYSFVSISSSKRDNDSISDFDKYESNFVKMNEGLLLQNNINCYIVMKTLEAQFGPFNEDEINMNMKDILTDNEGHYYINVFQKQLIFSMFYKYFGDTQSIYAINRRQYVELIIIAKKILLSKGMVILPYIVSGRVDKLVSRKSVNKKEKALVEASPTYPLLVQKYKDENITLQILGIIATIISSDFSIIDLDPEINGKPLETTAVNMIIEEVEAYILMC